jgi:ABC-type protease/lipase transport system fused ATPase/permease subunit
MQQGRLQTSGQYLRNIKMVHSTLLIGMIIFSVIVVVLMMTMSLFEEDAASLHQVMKFVVPVISLAAFIGSGFLFKKKMDAVKQATGISFGYRMDQYRNASIVRWAMLEGAVMLALIAQLLTKNYYYSIFIFLLLVFFFLYAPSAEKIKTQLQLNSEEQAMLDDEYSEWT